MAVGVKLGAFAGFVRILLVSFLPIAGQWAYALWVLAVLTMTIGNVIAVVQTNIKRMLAYSAIAHAGYVLVGMIAATPEGGAAVLYYLLAYAFTTLGAFGIVVALERRQLAGDLIADYRGLSTRSPALAGAMAVFLLSFTGVPPLAGFMGKFYVFSAALRQGYTYLVVIAVINSVIAAFYYISVIVAMYMEEGGVEPARMTRKPALVAAIGLSALATVLVGVYPAPYMSAAQDAFNSALGEAALRAASFNQ
jgi:NADH-quinone oxidoreductase subunit N